MVHQPDEDETDRNNSSQGGSASSPHDAVFRRVFRDPATAASQLRSVLPAEVCASLDLERLKPYPSSFVGDDMRWRHADLVFTVPCDGAEAFVHVLVEHQSRTDPLMPYRMLRYMQRIWDEYLDSHKGAARLPLVLPLVVHPSAQPWSGPTQLEQVIDAPAELTASLGDHMPRLRFWLDDLARIDVAALHLRPLTPQGRFTLALLLEMSRTRQVQHLFTAFADDVTGVLAQPRGIGVFVSWLEYIVGVGEGLTDDLRDAVAPFGKAAEEAYVTTADMLRAEGHAKGHAEGLVAALVQVAMARFGSIAPEQRRRIDAATPDELHRWLARVAIAPSLDDLLR